MTALNPNPPQSTLLPICHLLEPGEYERRRWKTLRVEDEFLDPFLAEKQLEDQRVMVAKNRNPQASRLTAADVVRSKSFDAPRRDRGADATDFEAALLAEACRELLARDGSVHDARDVAAAVRRALEDPRRAADAVGRSPRRGSKRERTSQLQRLTSRPFSTRFGWFLDERSSLGTVSKRGCFYQNARARGTLTLKRR